MSDREQCQARRAAQLEAILESAVDAIITIDERGIIESANAATEKIFGYSIEELVGRNVNILMPQPYRREHDRYVGDYLRGGEPKIIGVGREAVGQRKDGSTFPIALAVSEASLDGRRFFVGLVRDLSQLVAAQQREIAFGRIIEESLNEIYIFDADSWRFQQVNRGGRENLGYSMEELQQMTLLDIQPQWNPQSLLDSIEPLVHGPEQRIHFPAVHRRQDGSQYFAEVDLQQSEYQGRPVLVAIVVDVTEQRKGGELLRVHQRAIEAAGSGIVITDPNRPDNPIVICNPAFLEITGYSRDEIIGRNCRFLQADDRRQQGIDELREAITAEKECRVLIRNYRKDGAMFWNDLQVSPVHNASGDRVTHFVGIVADVTHLERKQSALRETIEEKSEQLRAAESELIKQARLATLGQLSGGIAHEIRNPLNALRTSAYFLLNARRITPEKTTEHLHRIDRQVTLIDNIVTALSDVAKMPQPALNPVPLEAWVPQAAHEVSVGHAIELRIDLPPDLPPALVDVNQVTIALKNLVRNARDAMPNGGSITISADASEGTIRLKVSDTGIGIEESILPKIMDPLFSTKSRGIGLGLAISRTIIEKNQGMIDVQSTLGKGTTFTIHFKAAAQST